MATRDGAIAWRESMLALPRHRNAELSASWARDVDAARDELDRQHRAEIKRLRALPVDASDSDVRRAVAS